jgi:hypothetical protein
MARQDVFGTFSQRRNGGTRRLGRVTVGLITCDVAALCGIMGWVAGAGVGWRARDNGGGEGRCRSVGRSSSEYAR